MEAVPRMPMIWLDLKEAGEFQFSPSVRQFILKNYGENPDNYNEQLKKLETLRQSAVNVTRDFEGCSTLRKYFGQLHYLQSRVPMGVSQEAAVPISWTEIFSGKTVTHDDISYEQACILYNLGALHSMLGAMDNRVSEEGMKVSCTHFQCSAGAFSYLRDHFSHNFSVDMSHQILNLNINLMLGQAQECLLEKSMLDNRKSFLVARISAQVVDYYKEACRALENSETASMLGKIQKDWKKLVQMKIYYFAAIAHLHMGKQAEEQQKYGERLAYLQSSLDKLSEAIKLAKGQPDSVQEALRFTMDVIGGKFNSAKKDNDFIYHETVPSLETLASVKGAPLVKALPVNPTDPSVTGPDLFAKLVPMAAHEASSLYSEEKAKLLRDVMAKIESKNETLEQFMDSLGLEPESVDNLDMYSHIPPVLMEKCAALSVRPDTVKSLIQSMQVLSGVFTDVESSLKEIRDVLEADEASERALQEVIGAAAAGEPHLAAQSQALAEIRRDLEKYMEAHEKASFTNTELHRAMNLHISNLRLLGGPLESLREALPRPQLSEEEVAGLQCMKRILGKVQEMREQRGSLEKQLRDLIQQDDITSTLVTTDRADMKHIFEDQLKKYEQVKVYIDQNLAAQENILKALTEANVQYATIRKGLTQTEQQWNSTVQGLVGSYEAYEDLMKKSQEGKEFYDDLEAKASRLLERAKALFLNVFRVLLSFFLRETQKKPPARPTAAKPSLNLEDPELAQLSAAILALGGDLPEDLRSLPPDMSALPAARQPGPEAFLPPGANRGGSSSLPWPGAPAAGLPRFPANLPPPELLARIAQFPVAGGLAAQGPLPRGPLPQITPQMPPQMPAQATVSGYGPPPPQAPHPGPVAPTPVRPSTTTVDSIQAPIPSYAPTPHQPVLPPASTGYSVPPQIGSYPHFMPQPGMPIQGPGQPAAPQPQQQKHLQPYPHPIGQPLPQGYQPGPHPPLQTQQSYPHGYMPPRPGVPPQYQQPFPGQLQPHQQNGFQPQPQIPQGYQTSRGFAPQQHSQMMPRAPQPQIPPQAAHPQMPSTSQPGPPVSQPYLPHSNQQMPPRLPHPHMLPPQQQISMAPQQIPPHPQMQIPGCPRGQMPPTSQPMPPVSQNYLPPASQPIHPTLQPQVHMARAPPTVPSPSAVSPSTSLFQRQNSSTDDLLSSSPESQPGGTKAPTNVLQPTKADPQDGERRKKSSQGVLLIQGDPYQAPERVARLHSELGRYRAQVDSLEHPSETEGGLSVLDARWKELQDQQEKDARQLSIAIARCYTMKNRHQDVMPYDLNRVVLQSGKDDYINASYVEDLSPYCPRLIATQAPLTGTAADFWLMVYEQKVSLIVMLVSELELDKGKVLRYFPTERGQQLSQGPITLSLTTQKTTPTHVEHMISLQYRDQSLKRTVVHLQFTSWPELGLPDSKSNLLRFIQEVHGHYLHQRPLHTPVVVHCSSGVGRTGAFCLLYAALQELEAGNGIPDLPLLVKKMRQQRKNMLQEKLHLKFCYEAVLKHAEHVLQRHGITTATCSKNTNPYSRQESQQDIVLGGDMPISSIQATIAKLSIRPPSATDPAMEAQCGVEEQAGTFPPDLDSLGDIQPLQDASFSPPVASLPPDSSAPAPSSLELLASLTPEAFSMEGGGRGKQRVTKQSFLQPAEGQGLHGTRENQADDPLSSLDPLWSLNKR
uniref:Tyrosine-protein phosphatase non-receptor type 23 n=1 Tax=Echeneis naucrates TaxID=173247 RepID=A0A665T5J0_ECHNA